MTDEPRNQNDIENLIVSHFDGTLNEEQEKELAEALSTSAEAKQLFLGYMRMEGRLHSLGRDGFLRDPIAELDKPTPQPVDIAPVIGSDRQRLRLFAASTSLAVCAAVLLMLSSWVLWPSAVSASSVLQEAQKAAAELIDRTYRVILSEAGERSQTRELTIHVRGKGRFVVQPVDGAYVMGSDGTDYWVARQSGPVWVASDFRSLAPKIQRNIPDRRLLELAASPNEPLLWEMADLLSFIERNYIVKLVESTSVAEHHVRATLRSGRRNIPALIDFWADADSGVVRRADVRWSDSRRMQFELVESAPLSDQWYHHLEHAPGREVERLDAANAQ